MTSGYRLSLSLGVVAKKERVKPKLFWMG